MNDVIYVPFTYLIKFKPTGQLYYGVRYKRGCNPKELFNTYFTSSKIVKTLIKQHGIEAFDYEIRKEFSGKPNKAREWESKVLIRLDVMNNPVWLNQSNNKSISYEKGLEGSIKAQKTNTGRKRSEQHNNIMILSNKTRTVSLSTRNLHSTNTKRLIQEGKVKRRAPNTYYMRDTLTDEEAEINNIQAFCILRKFSYTNVCKSVRTEKLYLNRYFFKRESKFKFV